MIVAGIGCRKDCRAEEIVALVRHAQAQAGRIADTLAAPDFKSDEPALGEAAAALALKLTFVGRTALEAAQPRCLTRSVTTHAAVGLDSVAEACALAVAGPTSRLLLSRIASARATCALAMGNPT